MKKRLLVVCPGRGSYTKETLGYLKKRKSEGSGFLKNMDRWRTELQEPTITELDQATTFQPGLHTKGEHASTLIYACAYADFLAIDRNQFDVVAVTGNSMGWYLTLAFAKALSEENAFRVINTMGSMMKEKIIGGQIIYPVVDENWRENSATQLLIKDLISKAREAGGEAYISIFLGGYLVLAGDSIGLNFLLKNLPKVENYPFQLVNHAAFHTPMLKETSAKAFEVLPLDLFQASELPMIDGRGKIWQPYATDVDELYGYTLGHQVVAPYDFSTAISVGLKEFAPDAIALLGPGNSLGGAIGQILVKNQWLGIQNKSDFVQLQKEKPFLISTGLT